MKITNYLKKIDENRDDGTEHTFRTNLENYLNSKKLNEDIKIHQELKKRRDENGTPDFKVFQIDKSYKKMIGYIECKKLNYDLEKLAKSEQIKKYSRFAKNILITNYTDFWLLDSGKVVEKAKIENETEFQNLFNNFLNYKYPQIKTSSEIVKMLASQSFYLAKTLKEYISEDEHREINFYKKLKALFEEFGNSVKYQYSLDEFCDLYSQSMIYGLFSSLIGGNSFDETAKDPIILIPEQHKLLIEFLDTGYNRLNLPQVVEMVLSSIMKNLNLIDIEHIEKFEEKQRDNLMIYLYEDFLKEYDKESKKSSGVYYTPPAITKFITSSISDILESSLNLKDRYISDEVKILDFATGTGTFLLSIFDEILEKSQKVSYIKRAKKKIVNDIYGFELLFTPYIVAHINLERKLNLKNIYLEENERLGVYLTNTLDFSQNSISNFLPYLQEETEKANEIKNAKDVLIILGNPPYNNKSKNSDSKITELLLDYKKGLSERKINLDDDYIKFIRFAQKKIDDAGYGVFGTITNNSFLDGLTHRKMRESLLSTFDEIYIINLHGNTLKKEGDKNVFDIMVGVSITLFVKRKISLKEKIVKYYSTLENNHILRKEKFDFLNSKTLANIEFTDLEPKEPNFWFVAKDETGIEDYAKFKGVTEIFDIYSAGIETQKDNIAIQYSEKSLEKLKKDFLKYDERDLREKYQIKDGRDWKLLKAKLSFRNCNTQKISYRPFDFRFTNYSQGFVAYPRTEIMQHFLNGKNIGLVFERNKVNNCFQHIFVTKHILNRDVICSASYTAPLYKYIENMGEIEKIPNFTKKFQDFLQTLDFSPTPEEILSYIYARLHSNRFRKKYFEFLKTDFPKVPFTENENEFFQFAKLGEKLVNLHIMKSELDDDEVEVKLDVKLDKNLFVEKIVFDSENETLWINDSFYILGVSQEIWDFEIGSYKVLDKWLKYRKKDKIEVENFEHLEQIVIVIKQTLEIMAEIDLL